MIRPHQLALCQLAVVYIAPVDGHVLPSEALQELCAFLLREVSQQAAASATYPSLSALLEALAASVPGPAGSHIAHLLVDALQKLESPDDVLQKFLDLRELLSTRIAGGAGNDAGHPTSVEPRSSIGLFVRRCLAQALALPFEAMCRLWEEVLEYVQDDMMVYSEGGGLVSGGSGYLRDVTSLERQLNRRLTAADQLPGRAVPGQLELELKQMAVVASDIPKVHLMQHIAALQARDSAAATAALHRYFDYSSGRQHPGQAGMGANMAAIGGGPPASDAQPRPGAAARLSEMHAAAGLPNGNLGIGRFQSALLSLGAAHTTLGHTREAYQALEETVRIAQQASDNQVLVHALAALCRLSMSAPPPAGSSEAAGAGHAASLQGDSGGNSALPGETPATAHRRVLLHLLHRCLQRGRELKVPHLVAYARLAMARVQLEGLGTPGPAARPESPQPGLPTSGGGLDVTAALQALERLNHLSALAVPVPTASAMGGKGAAGGRQSAAAPALRSLTEIFPATQGLFVSQPDGSLAASAAAVSRLTGEAHLLSAAAWHLHGCPELSLCHLLIHAGSYAHTASSTDTANGLGCLASVLSTSRGAEVGLAALELHREMLPEGGLPAVEEASALLGAQAEVAARNPRGAARAGGRLCAMAPPSAGRHSATWIEGEMACIQAVAAAGDSCQAVEAAQALFARCHAAGRQAECVRLLCLMGECHLDAGSHVTALPYLLSCASHCRDTGMDVLGAQATVGLAEAWCGLGEQHAPRALALLRRVQPLVFGRGGKALGARTRLATAAAMLQVAEPGDVASSPELVLDMLRAATDDFAQIGSLAKAGEAAYLAALVADAAGLHERRDAEAARWLQLTTRSPGAARCGAPDAAVGARRASADVAAAIEAI